MFVTVHDSPAVEAKRDHFLRTLLGYLTPA